jgi:hypothetical protein
MLPTPAGDDHPIEIPDFRALGLSKAMYTVADTVSVLSIGKTRLYELVADRELNPVRFGRRTLFFASDLASFLMRLRGLKAPPREPQRATRSASQPVAPQAKSPRRRKARHKTAAPVAIQQQP